MDEIWVLKELCFGSPTPSEQERPGYKEKRELINASNLTGDPVSNTISGGVAIIRQEPYISLTNAFSVSMLGRLVHMRQ